MTDHLLVHKDGRHAVGRLEEGFWILFVEEDTGNVWNQDEVKKAIRLHPGIIDPLVEAECLDEEGDEGPFTWRQGHCRIDRGPTMNQVVVTYKVHLISPEHVFLALEGTANSADDLAYQWEVPDEVILDLIALSDVELCTTCDWWCHKDELEIIDDEPKCQECREDE